MNLKPLNDHVVVKPLNAEETTKSGIILPDTVDKEKPEKGEVLAVGPGKLLENGQRAEIGISVGQKVLFKKYSADEFKIDNEELLVVEAGDIIGIIE